MPDRQWPSREEWQAKAEHAVRTACTMYERLDRLQPGTRWSSLGEDIEYEELARPAAAELRPLLTAEINRLRALLPGRPKATKARVAWFIELEGQRYEDACNLGAFEEMRREIQRAVREESWGVVAWHLGRLRKYPSIPLTEGLLAAHDRMVELSAAAEERLRQAAQAAEDAAVAREVARRATDEAWEEELERQTRVDQPRVIRYG